MQAALYARKGPQKGGRTSVRLALALIGGTWVAPGSLRLESRVVGFAAIAAALAKLSLGCRWRPAGCLFRCPPLCCGS